MGDGGGTRWSRGVQRGAPGSRTTRLELFYDLVFVFAFLNVTSLTSSTPTPVNLFRCLLVLALLWWCWTGFAGMATLVRADRGVLPVVGFTTVAATFLLALTMPGAFVDRPGGLNGPLVFAGCYLLVRAAQLAIVGWLARSDPVERRRWLLQAALPVVASALLIAAGVVPSRIDGRPVAIAVQLGFWTLALAIEFGVGTGVG
ncbi:low temperature requirement protein A, partial [Micromonospora sicca]|uniref:low temperature requirement protein A n=2 Tax=Micromonospora TaxID=1873 RepID=UPI001F1D5F92